MTNTEKRLAFQKDCALLQAYAQARGIQYLITAYYRTPEQQLTLFNEGKSRCDGFQKVSAHQKWLAMDLAILNPDGSVQWQRDKRYEDLGQYWKEQRKNVWGGDWPGLNDIYHFEFRDALS
jgi:hypothetical protein